MTVNNCKDICICFKRLAVQCPAMESISPVVALDCEVSTCMNLSRHSQATIAIQNEVSDDAIHMFLQKLSHKCHYSFLLQ